MLGVCCARLPPVQSEKGGNLSASIMEANTTMSEAEQFENAVRDKRFIVVQLPHNVLDSTDGCEVDVLGGVAEASAQAIQEIEGFDPDCPITLIHNPVCPLTPCDQRGRAAYLYENGELTAYPYDGAGLYPTAH